MKTSSQQAPADFSLVLGGPLYQLYLRTRLAQPPLALVHRRVIAAIAITWLPLLLLTTLAQQAVGGVRVPFLLDLEVHARFLATLPLLIGAELIVHFQISTVVAEFTKRNLVAPEDQGRFESLLASSMRLRNSVLGETVLLAVAFLGGHWLWQQQLALHVPTWYGSQGDEGVVRLTPAGYWYGFISLPVLRFILLRWLYRLLIWYRFLWKVSRIRLRLDPLHSDRSGGLGFLEQSVFGFGPVVLAVSVMVSAFIANRIFFDGVKLLDQKADLIGIPVILIMIVLAPLCFFIVQLARAKIRGRIEYGRLASRYVAGFREKWLAGAAEHEPLVGSSDIQSLADLSNSFDVVSRMRFVPFGRDTLIALVGQVALPLLPLALTMVPLDEILDRAIKVLI